MFIKLTSLSHFWAREKMIYKIIHRSYILSSGKNDLQNQPRSYISELGKKWFTKSFFSAILSQAKVFNVIPWGDKDAVYEIL